LSLGSPSALTAIPASAQAIWNTTSGEDSKAATPAAQGYGTYLPNQSPETLFDNTNKTKYSSRGNSSNGSNNIAGLNTGFYVTVQKCQAVLTGFSFLPGFGTSTSDPLNVTIEGSNAANLTIGINWDHIYNGPTGLMNIADRSEAGYTQTVTPSKSYISYRFLITAKAGTSDFVTYAGVNLFGYHG
jgi:hypothetical protein